MSPVRHPINGRALSFVLDDELRILRQQLEAAPGRLGRTIVKVGALRATLVGLTPGGALRPHKADGPITLHVLEGTIELEAEGRAWTLAAGTLFALDAGIVHAVTAPQGGIFLLTLVQEPARRGDAAPAVEDARTAPHGES
jgi:quercetin dioxygenase-like cupin family protein